MKSSLRSFAVAICVLALVVGAFAQSGKQPEKKTGILAGADLKLVVPTTYFFDDQVAPVQARNSIAIRSQDARIVAAGLVDNSGYSADVAQKYQGFFITSKKISIEGHTLNPGEYGFGFGPEGKFRIMDAGAGDMFSVAFHQDDKLQRPVPLQAVASGKDFRLYAGKKFVTVSIQ